MTCPTTWPYRRPENHRVSLSFGLGVAAALFVFLSACGGDLSAQDPDQEKEYDEIKAASAVDATATIAPSSVKVGGQVEIRVDVTLKKKSTVVDIHAELLKPDGTPSGYSLELLGRSVTATNPIHETDSFSFEETDPKGEYTLSVTVVHTGTGKKLVEKPAIAKVTVGGGASDDTEKPTIPQKLSAKATSASAIDLAWEASTDNVGVTGYTIYRDGTEVGTSKTTSVADSGLEADTTYKYTVDAFDAAGNHADRSAEVSAKTSNGGDTPTVSAAFAPNPVQVGKSYTLTTNTSNATKLTYQCTGALSQDGTLKTGENQTKAMTALENQVGETQCVFTATGSNGDTATATAKLTIQSAPPPDEGPSVDLPGYELVWKDEFDGTALDTEKWTIDTDARRDAVNSASAVGVADGHLAITTYTENGTNYTGFLQSVYQPTFGFIEARIRFQPSPGEWGAFWLQSDTYSEPIGNPAEAGAEVDIIEHRAVNQGGDDLNAIYATAVHWDGYGDDHKDDGSDLLTYKESLTGVWHTWAVLWTDSGYEFYLDGKKYWSTEGGLSKRSEHLRLTCEVSDGDWAGSIPDGGFGSLETSKTKLDVDWVRVWQKP